MLWVPELILGTQSDPQTQIQITNDKEKLMIKEFYEVRTWIKYEKVVLVPKDEVNGELEAKELVREATGDCTIELLNDVSCLDEGEEVIGEFRINDSLFDNSEKQIIHRKFDFGEDDDI